MKKKITYKIIGAYDSETTNYVKDGHKNAYPILHQLGLITPHKIEEINAQNVEQFTKISLFRNTIDLYQVLDELAASITAYVPVILCHNLAFDMYGLAPYFSQRKVKVLAKSQRKPISFTILDEDEQPRLVIWDTLIFSQKSLSYMGKECGYAKLKGDWDYDLIRTPQTPLTDKEIGYAKHDIYCLLAWLGYWLRLNPDIPADLLAHKVVSKTGVVRNRRLLRFGKVKGIGRTKNVKKYWQSLNIQNAPKSDDELFTNIACTRGGFTFCARNNANRVFDFSNDENKKVYGYDATSQHPSQIVSHRYPVRFTETTPQNLTLAFKIIAQHSVEDVLTHYERPFSVAFNGYFRFKNLRLKKDSLFERFGIAPLASARCKTYKSHDFMLEENQQGEEFKQHISDAGYRDKVQGEVSAFGKIEACDYCELYLTELAAWEISQAYDFDSVEGLHGYATLSFDKPSDLAVISVMQFYEAKNEFKIAQEYFYNNEPIKNAQRLKDLGIPDFVVDGMENHTIEDSIIKSTYLGLKADLNALFGIEATNEYMRDTVLKDEGIAYEGEFGIVNAPKLNKAFYQFGQRIVGWSRIAQILVMELCYPYIETIINGDTDSVKFVIQNENVQNVTDVLLKMNEAIDTAKNDVCARIKTSYPKFYSNLDGIGYYICEFETRQFCAAWNKAYCIREYDKRDKKLHCHFTLAGVPALNVDTLADNLIEQGWSFGDVCDRFLGYNTTYANDCIKLNARSFPQWSELFKATVTDYLGNEARVCEPAALCLYPMSKSLNDVGVKENLINMQYALKNRPSVKTSNAIVTKDKIIEVGDLIEQ